MVNGQFRLIDLIDDMCAGKDVFFQSVRTAEDVMTYHVKTLSLDDSLETCVKFMKNNKVRHAPIIDIATEGEEKPYFVGVVSERDVLRQISPYVGKIGEEKTDSKALRQPLGQIITRKPKSVSPETPMAEMIAVMVDNHVDMVPVLTNGDLLGIVTASDIINLFVRLDAIRSLCAETGKKQRLVDVLSGGSDEAAAALASVMRTVGDIMVEQVVCLEEQDTLGKAMEVMQQGKFRHVPVVNKQNKLVGIVSDRDVLRHLPFPGGDSTSQTETFRGRLFAVDPKEQNLKLSLSRIMTREVVHVSAADSFYDAVKKLYEMRVSCLPVVDEEEKLKGIFTVTDVMRALLAAYRLTEKSQSSRQLCSKA
jgi:acetoin utilization protein AcuB